MCLYKICVLFERYIGILPNGNYRAYIIFSCNYHYTVVKLSALDASYVLSI